MNGDDWGKLLFLPGLLIFAIYFVSMVVVPLACFGWDHTLDVWDRWQGFNVGMIALLSSVVALNISYRRASAERKQIFAASRAYLPHELSALTEYCRESMDVYREAWPRVSDIGDHCDTPLQQIVPELPEGYRKVFQDIITFEEPVVSNALADIVMKLQIHSSRMKEVVRCFQANSSRLLIPSNINNNLIVIAEIQALINRFYPYARRTDEYEDEPLDYDAYRSALVVNGVDVEAFSDLEEAIQREIERRATLP
jgi:hypothetical protein